MGYPFENLQVTNSVKTGKVFRIDKMEDEYLSVRFAYQGTVWNGAIPLKAKYQGISIPYTEEDVLAWVEECYEALSPANAADWTYEQRSFWAGRQSEDTKLVFDALNGDGATTRWLCRKCGPVPAVNPQPAARLRSIKQLGFHVATLKMVCSSCGKKQYHDLLIRLPRHAANNQKRSTITKALRSRILEVLPQVDCLTQTPLEKAACIVDHKFPSSRWVQGESINETDMPVDAIKRKFQILSNQSNLQKERYCQRCVIDGIRGDMFGIVWYYQGERLWEGTSKADEEGCLGCPWYDIEKWRAAFTSHLEGYEYGVIDFPAKTNGE